MSQVHITPLSRNQLLDLESLIQALIYTVSHPVTPISTPRGLSRSPSTGAFPSIPQHHGGGGVNTLSVDTLLEASLPCSPSTLPTRPDHPILHGNFVDVFRDPYTKQAWRLHDKLLYLVWWSYRPPSCLQCGAQDSWVPSGDGEAKCVQCGGEAGSTRLNDVVEDTHGREDDVSGADTDDGGDGEENDDGEGGFSSNPTAAYALFYDWLQQLPRVCSAAGGGAAVGAGIALPSGEALPTVLRAAYDMAGLLTVPGMAPGTSHATRAAALYLSLALHRFAVPFPLLTLAVRHQQPPHARSPTPSPSPSPRYQQQQQRQPSVLGTEGGSGDPGKSTGRIPAFGSYGVESGGADLQWVDVELAAALLGVTLADFFERPQVSAQYVQNVMTVAAKYGAPSILWHHARVPRRTEVIAELRAHRQGIVPPYLSEAFGGATTATTGAGTGGNTATGLSPEHTAMVVVLELARLVDEQPITASSSSAAAAEQNGRRIGQWLDVLGLYPKREYVYRDHAAGGGGNNTAAGATTLTAVAAVSDTGVQEALTNRDALVTTGSVFAHSAEALLLSPCANAILHVLATAFNVTPLELCELAIRSGLYRGPTRFLEVLYTAMESGRYAAMPLARRLSPANTAWLSVYLALHSDDRYPFLAALAQLSGVQNGSRDRFLVLCKLLQRLVRRHQSSMCYQFNYLLRVVDETEKHFNGLYFLSALLGQEGLAVFTCLRSGRKTITFNARNGRITLSYLSSKERVVDRLDVRVHPPVVAFIERETAKLVVDATVNRTTALDQWGTVVRALDRCARVRRRMQVPMLASRLDALASIRDATATARHRPIAALSSLLGWGETETLLSMPAPIDALRLRSELQTNLLLLPSPSLLAGVSENRVVALYSSLVALLGYIAAQLLEQQHQQQAGAKAKGDGSASAAPPLNWVEELLCEDDDEDGGGRKSYLGSPTQHNGHQSHHHRRSTDVSPLVASRRPLSPPRCSPPLRAAMTPLFGPSTVSTLCAPGPQSEPPPPLALEPAATVQSPRSPGDEDRGSASASSSSAVTKRVKQYRAVMSHLSDVPPYWEVLLGHAGSYPSRLSDVAARRVPPVRGRRRRGPGRGAAPIAHPTEAAITMEHFGLLQAEECRRRLHHFLVFIQAYRRHREELWTLTAAGALTVRECREGPQRHHAGVGAAPSVAAKTTSPPQRSQGSGEAGAAPGARRSPQGGSAGTTTRRWRGGTPSGGGRLSTVSPRVVSSGGGGGRAGPDGEGGAPSFTLPPSVVDRVPERSGDRKRGRGGRQNDSDDDGSGGSTGSGGRGERDSNTGSSRSASSNSADKSSGDSETDVDAEPTRRNRQKKAGRRRRRLEKRQQHKGAKYTAEEPAPLRKETQGPRVRDHEEDTGGGSGGRATLQRRQHSAHSPALHAAATTTTTGAARVKVRAAPTRPQRAMEETGEASDAREVASLSSPSSSSTSSVERGRRRRITRTHHNPLRSGDGSDSDADQYDADAN